MNNIEFANKAKDIALNYKTLYVLGCFGAPLNPINKKRYTNNYEYNKRNVRKNKILDVSNDTFGFDCVCLIKGILWGWNGNLNHVYGGAKYASNGVLDISSDQLVEYCTCVSTDFDDIQVGEIVHMPGHTGICVGDGLVVECIPIWKDGVQITSLLNINSKAGYEGRIWFEHGKLKWIEYVSDNLIQKKLNIENLAKEVIQGLWGNGEERRQRLEDYGYDYDEVQRKVNELLGNNLYYPKSDYKGNSLVDALKVLKIDATFKNRSNIAKKNGIKLYFGTASQNIKLLQLLKDGKLKK